MRYPIGKGTQDDFDKYWYIASSFGENRGSYYHSGDDYNLKTGGDSDLGQPLYAICDGEITGTDTTSTTGFGKQIYLKFQIDGKNYWAGYDHCQMVAVDPGQKVKEGQVVGYLGKTGTNYAHLHFVIKNKANGMDNVPNTVEELKEWENPTEFIKKYLGESPEGGNMIEVPQEDFENLVTKSTKYDAFVQAGYNTAEDVEQKVDQLENDKKNAENKILELESEMEGHECPSNETLEDTLNGTLNGYTKQYEKNGILVTENYKV